MFNVETHTAAAVDVARKAANAADKKLSNLDAAMTAVFAAYLAADPALSAKAVGKIIGDKVPQSKEAGNPSAVRKSRCVTYFSDSANVAALRRAIPSPEAMEPDVFTQAVNTFCADVNPRKWIAESKAQKGEAVKATAEAVAAAQREPAEDEQTGVLNPEFDPVLSAQTSASKAIAALIDMATRDCPERDDANAALTMLLNQIAKASEAPLQQAA